MKLIPELEDALAGYRPYALETLKKWISQPSIKGPQAEGAPYGADTRKMLDIALGDCDLLGFDVKDIDGYACQADLGEGSEIDALAILGHLDVVPVGDGWTKPPFGAVEEDGRIYGRGAIDDKGPVLSALFAMAAVKKAGIKLNRRVRLIMGCDEETGMSDMLYYKQHAVMPRSGFSPDADYPLINIEKGGCHVMLKGKLSGKGLRIKEFSVGERINVIPGKATAVVYGGQNEKKALQESADRLGFPVDILESDGCLQVTTYGKTGHAAMGENASNAIGQMLKILSFAGAEGAVHALADYIGMTYYGENLGIAMEDRVSGKLTCSLDIIKTEGEEINAFLDIRYPILLDTERMLKVMNMTLDGDLDAQILSQHAPHYVSENSRLVKELLSAYTFVTGRKGQAMAIGGGTYAQMMEEGVAFGAKFPEEPEMAHQADEYITIKNFYESMRIIAYAIVRLAGGGRNL